MDNRTLKYYGTRLFGMDNSVVKSLEAYRFAFIAYLETAKKLCELNREAQSIQELCHVYETGRSIDDPVMGALQDELSLRVERTLFRLYHLDRTKNGFRQAYYQFSFDLEYTKKQEQYLWDELVVAADEITFCDCGEIVWVKNSPEAHRDLLINDGKSIERIEYYLDRLKDYNKTPVLPEALEVLFGLAYGSLIKTISFST